VSIGHVLLAYRPTGVGTPCEARTRTPYGFSFVGCYVYQFHQRGVRLYLVNGAGKSGVTVKKTSRAAAGRKRRFPDLTAEINGGLVGRGRQGGRLQLAPPRGAAGGECCAGARSQGGTELPSRGITPRGTAAGTGADTRGGGAARSAISSRLALAVRSRSLTGSRGCIAAGCRSASGTASCKSAAILEILYRAGGRGFLTPSGRPPATRRGASKPQGFSAGLSPARAAPTSTGAGWGAARP
jgi:hypothetical protein